MLVVLACGLPVTEPTTTPPHPVLGVYEPSRIGDSNPLRHLTDVLAPTLERGSTVVAIVPTWDEEPLHTRLRAIRSALDTTRLVVHTTALPPLAAAAFAFLVAEIARQELLSPGVLLSRLDQLSDHVVGAAWLGSVTRLTRPSAGLLLHARSYLPRSAFGAVIDHQPRVFPLKRKDGALLPLPQARVRSVWRAYVAASETGDADLVNRSLREHAWGAFPTQVPLTDVSTAWWGTTRLVELALIPNAVAAVAEAVADGPHQRACHWCGERILPPACPYCGDRSAALESIAADVSTGGPV